MSRVPPDIFLSYAHEDLEWVRRLAAELERQGWRVFWDRRIPAGKSWRSHLVTRLEVSRCVIVVWSEHAVTSKFVLQEADAGLERDVLVPVLRASIRPPMGFREIHSADLSGWHRDQPSAELDALMADLGELLDAAAAPKRKGTLRIYPIARSDLAPIDIIFDGEDILVGRSPECDICIANDEEVSKNHCTLAPMLDGRILVGNSSVRGTQVNGAWVHRFLIAEPKLILGVDRTELCISYLPDNPIV